MTGFNFTKRKFLALPDMQRHKKCAELLRQAYEKMAAGAQAEQELSVYNMLMEWSGCPGIKNPSPKEISDSFHHHAALGAVHHKEHRLLPSIRTGDKAAGAAPWPIAIYLDNIRSAHNVGSILRTVEAFSLGSVHFSPNTPFATHKQVQDAAMGAAAWVDCHSDASLDRLPKPIFALETSDTAAPLYDFPFPEAFTLVIGNEEYGCSDDTLKKADALIEIPLRGRKNSLNVANAFSIAAAEISRQRTRARA